MNSLSAREKAKAFLETSETPTHPVEYRTLLAMQSIAYSLIVRQEEEDKKKNVSISI